MLDTREPALSREDIYMGGRIKADVAELILREGTLYLHDVLAAKAQFEQKASVLMGAYFTLAVGLAGAVLVGRDEFQVVTAWVLMACAIFFGGAGLFCMWALRDQVYGTPGINPRDWLTSYWLRDRGRNSTVAKATAMMAAELEEDIKLAIDRNANKANAISAGIYISIGAAVIAMAAACWELCSKP